jgi:hypothetical protein
VPRGFGLLAPFVANPEKSIVLLPPLADDLIGGAGDKIVTGFAIAAGLGEG